MRTSWKRNHASRSSGESTSASFEPPDGASPGDGAVEHVTRARVAYALDEVAHVLVPLVGGKRVDRAQAARLRVRVALLFEVLAPEHDLAGRGVQPPAVLVAVVVERYCEVVEVDRLHTEHIQLIYLARSRRPARAERV
jgi:hypothetical protein